MSVQTEIDRIISAVDAAHAKVAEKGGTTARPYLVANLAEAIDTIPEASDPVLQEKTVSPATSAQSVTPDSGYDGLSKVTVNAMPTATQATPSITVSSGGLITAKADQTAGYVASGTKQATKQLTTQGAQTITPGTSDKTIASGCYLTGTQTIKGDSNLVAANIAEGVSIFGVTGTHTGGANVETCTVTVDSCKDVFYMDVVDGVCVSKSIIGAATTETHTFTAARNSVIVCGRTRSPYLNTANTYGCETIITYMSYYSAFKVVDDSVYIKFT